MGKIGIGVIGAGGIAARLHLPELAQIEEFEVRILAGRRQSRLDLLAEKFGGRTTSNYQEVIDAPDVDAVVVAQLRKEGQDRVGVMVDSRRGVLRGRSV